MIVCALVGMPFAMRADREAVAQALEQHQNASSPGVDSEKTAKCCCKEESCSRPLDKGRVQRYQIFSKGENLCCKSLSKCGYVFGYNDPLDNDPLEDATGVGFDLSTCEMQVARCPAGKCPYGEPAIVWSTRQTGNSQLCGCACAKGDRFSRTGPGCDYCGDGYGPEYPICEKKCSHSCNGHGTAVGYGSDCTCDCEAGWMPEHKCKFKALAGSECVRKSYLLYAELSDTRGYHQAERFARLYCGMTKDHAESFNCLSDPPFVASQCMNTNGGMKEKCLWSASEQCIDKLMPRPWNPDYMDLFQRMFRA